MDGRMDAWKEGRLDGRKAGWMDGLMDGWMCFAARETMALMLSYAKIH